MERSIERNFGTQRVLPGERKIELEELKTLPAFDIEELGNMKETMDERVFDLYGLTKADRALIRGFASRA